LVVLWVITAWLSMPAAAQESPTISQHTGEALPLGPFLFSPALELTWEHRDNIFFDPVDPVDDNVYVARARLMLELPIYESYVRFSYTPQYRDYEEYSLEEKWSHFVDLSTVLESSSGLVFQAKYRYVDAALETSEVDPGGELFYGDQRFFKHYAKVGVDYWFTNRDGISIEGDFTDLWYDQPERSLFYDYTRTSAGVGWLHQLTALLVTDLKVRRIEFEPDNTVAYRRSEADEITVGFRGQWGPITSSEIRVGWRETSYDLEPGDPEISDYSGPVILGHVGWELAHGATLKLDLLRSDFPSNYGPNAYYTATGGGVTYNLNRGRLFGQARLRMQNNDYELPDPATGRERSDDIKTLSLGLGYRFTDLFSLHGSYLYENRESLTRFSYDVNFFKIGVVLGF
jgi:hypothetical protein